VCAVHGGVFIDALTDVSTSVKSVQNVLMFLVLSPLVMGYMQNSTSGCKFMSSFWTLMETQVRGKKRRRGRGLANRLYILYAEDKNWRC